MTTPTPEPTKAQLSGTDFVYLNVKGDPIRITRWGESLWAFYWHPDSRWVSLQKIGEAEAMEMKKHAMSPDHAAYYGVKHE